MPTDRFTVRAVVVGLVFVVLAIIGSLAWIVAVGDVTPEQRGVVLGVLGSLGTGALGGLTAMLAHTGSADPNPALEVLVPPAG